MKTLFVVVCIAACFISGCSSVSTAIRDDKNASVIARGIQVRFEASEFTQPGIDVSPDGKNIYFDALGEIYSVSVFGGTARQLRLGPGWKSSPMLSISGERIAFLSDRGLGISVWGRRLDSALDVQPYADLKNLEALSAAWVSDSQIVMSHMTAVSPSPLTLTISELDDSGAAILQRPVEPRSDIRMLVGSDPSRGHVYLRDQRLLRMDIATGAEWPLDGSYADVSDQIRISDDGRLMGYAVYNGGDALLSVRDLVAGTNVATKCYLDQVYDLAIRKLPTYDFLPDGGSVVQIRNGKFRICRFDGEITDIPVLIQFQRDLMPMAKASREPVRTPQIRHPTIDEVRSEVYFSARGKLWKSSFQEGSATRVTTTTREEFMPNYSPNGSKIAYVTLHDGVANLRVREIKSGEDRGIAQSLLRSFASPSWSPDGEKIAYLEVDQSSASGDPRIKVINLVNNSTGEFGSRADVRASGGSYPTITWSADGKGIFYTKKTRLNLSALVYHAVGKEAVSLLTFNSDILDVIVSPSGRRVAFVDRGGVSIAPMMARDQVWNEVHVISLDDVKGMRRIPVYGADYVRWTSRDELLWSVQNELYTSNDFRNVRRIVAISLPPYEADKAGDFVYFGAKVISMGDQGIIDNGVVVVSGHTIEFVGPAADLPKQYESATKVDISGKYVIPGLIDVHLHLSPQEDELTSNLNYGLFASAAYGVTTIFDPSVPTARSSQLQEITRDNDFRGATFYGSGAVLLGIPGQSAYADIQNLEQARGHIRRMVMAGSPLLKEYLRPSRQERRLIVQAARELGVGVVAHESNSIQKKLGLVEDGYTSIEHTLLTSYVPIYSDVVSYLAQSHISVTPTLAIKDGVFEFMAGRTKLDKKAQCLMREKYLERMRTKAGDSRYAELHPWVREDLVQSAEMLNAGVNITVGSHEAPYGLMTHWEMWALALGGASPMKALAAATVNGANKLNMQNRIGSIAKGLDADFVVLNSDPMVDIYSSVDISRVVRRGRTLQWPLGSRWPQSWPVQGVWAACSSWNLGVTRPDENSDHTIQ